MASFPVRIGKFFFTENLIDCIGQSDVIRSIHGTGWWCSFCIVFEYVLSEKVTRALVGVDLLGLSLGIFEMALIEWFSEQLILVLFFSAKNEVFRVLCFYN